MGLPFLNNKQLGKGWRACLERSIHSYDVSLLQCVDAEI